MAETLFYLLAGGALAFGAGVVRAKMPLFSVLCLLGTFVCLSAIYLLAGMQFLAATQLLVYGGAIMVLFLFVVMLLNLGDERELARHTGDALSGGRLALAGAAAGGLLVAGVGAAGWGTAYAATDEVAAAGIDRLDSIAEVLFSRYALPFEAASLLLLATMVAVMALAKRDRGALSRAREDAPGVAAPAADGPEKEVA